MTQKNRVKKRYKKKSKKKIIKKIISYLAILFVLAVFVYLYFKVTEPGSATEWSEVEVAKIEKVVLPKDDGHHSDGMEWWYYNGHLVTESGKEFSFHFTTFLVNNLTTQTVFHSSLTDHQSGYHFTDQVRVGGNLSAEAENKFNFRHLSWVMQGSNGSDVLKVENEKFAFDLSLESTLPVVLHGDHGVLPLGSFGKSYYYSRTRMNISGILDTGGVKESVKGEAWFDHQWGDFYTDKMSWVWFSIQLENGMDLMLYQISDKYGSPISYNGSISKNGKTEILNQDDFILVPKKNWVSAKTKKSYSIEWAVKVPQKEIDLVVKSVVKNSEFDAKLTTYLVYWEGAIEINGSHKGKGFLELNGYSDLANNKTD
ncbi:MAG: hypothetical protein L3J59_06350 [Methylococcaceae bacterium]|nr:hypothetical protein [Methylococcaceae bacterium]